MSFADSFFYLPVSAMTAITLFSILALATPIFVICALMTRKK